MKRNRSFFFRQNATYFLTTTITEFTKIFDIPDLAEILIRTINFYREKFCVKMHAFVIMPNHIHLLLTMGNIRTVSELMGRVKEYSAKEIVKWCQNNRRDDLLHIFQKSAKKYITRHEYQVWQRRFDDLIIDNDNTFNIKMDYIHGNPLQEHWKLAATPEEYPLSSAKFYFLGEETVIPISYMDE
ncbi:transposase [Candidatus Peregrinibacteria bacterium]|nr:transposase [Candidatus Peregrinibacteria bacterium]